MAAEMSRVEVLREWAAIDRRNAIISREKAATHFGKDAETYRGQGEWHDKQAAYFETEALQLLGLNEAQITMRRQYERLFACFAYKDLNETESEREGMYAYHIGFRTNDAQLDDWQPIIAEGLADTDLDGHTVYVACWLLD